MKFGPSGTLLHNIIPEWVLSHILAVSEWYSVCSLQQWGTWIWDALPPCLGLGTWLIARQISCASLHIWCSMSLEIQQREVCTFHWQTMDCWCILECTSMFQINSTCQTVVTVLVPASLRCETTGIHSLCRQEQTIIVQDPKGLPNYCMHCQPTCSHSQQQYCLGRWLCHWLAAHCQLHWQACWVSISIANCHIDLDSQESGTCKKEELCQLQKYYLACIILPASCLSCEALKYGLLVWVWR
jgi:hypothetical protein